MRQKSLSERYDRVLEKKLPDGTPWNALETALQFVDYALNGPQPAEDQFKRPIHRIYGGAEIDVSTLSAMSTALKFHKMDYEADVLSLALSLHILDFLSAKGGRADDDAIHKHYMVVRVKAVWGMERWPDRAYFYYGAIKSLVGQKYFQWAEQIAQHISRSSSRTRWL
ncbi:hypothetical protein SISNIDRAFT_461175 [Sistotremastrum niveocremeum HHB9708]|uniref:Uncharacterized protein n=2 Tax=Sistotremastraceae TaxID=3402574 RepID=A0A164MZZ8_9AGAM|nr:hypothetical protein SISNIDRAFT_461175 [Sistotremastrum niveocremeum HHB9708]KZT36367.1 hypothetical protein SISSUDRAFT_1049943 [Sistotremastrum suecicum HHB10207 ss-3]